MHALISCGFKLYSNGHQSRHRCRESRSGRVVGTFVRYLEPLQGPSTRVTSPHWSRYNPIGKTFPANTDVCLVFQPLAGLTKKGSPALRSALSRQTAGPPLKQAGGDRSNLALGLQRDRASPAPRCQAHSRTGTRAPHRGWGSAVNCPIINKDNRWQRAVAS